MKVNDKLENHLIELDVQFEKKDNNLYIVTDDKRSLNGVLVSIEDSVITIRVNVMEVPSGNKDKLFEKLLMLNASDMIHGAYAIEGKNIIIIDTLEGENMDLNELQAALDAIGLALTQHYKVLSGYRNK